MSDKKTFKPVDSKFDLVSLEKDVLNFWDQKEIFKKVDEKYKNSKEWVYYDGPITANGMPHYGHAITWLMKDIVPRYHTMKGEYVSRNIGWDCQGILVEYEVEKELGFKHKHDIEEMGVDKFNALCRKSVLDHRKDMIEYETRLGRWIDHTDEYATMDKDYIESMWWAISELNKKGLLYEGHKVVAYSTRAGMTLSAHEVADGGYKDIVDEAVTLKFKVRNTSNNADASAVTNTENTYILAWTTTPWTLPGNLMLAIGKKIEYVKVKSGNEYYILAKEALERVFGEDGNYEIVEDIKVEDLVDTEYEPLFPYYENKRSEGAFRVIYADHVNTEEGTGVVHLAPYGEDDFNIFLEMGMSLFDYLNDTGEFTDEIPDYTGMFYKKANKQIIKDLEEKGLLFKHEEYTHSMPMCYRTKTPLIYKPIQSWYVAINKIKPELVREAETINWVPERMKKRFLRWIEGARDWSLSRRRFWGTPMPIWVNDKTGEKVFVSSFKELEKLSGQKLPEDFDPHKPFVDDITWQGKDGGTFRRLPEVIDVWFDSGSMPFARYHYPFENQELFEKRFPAEYISESDDQIRLWFYTMFILGVALFDKAPFKNVIVTGMLGDEQGKKLSKSAHNYPPIEEVFEKYGGDMLRYFLSTSQISRGEFANFSYRYLEETRKSFFTTLWNSYRYFVTYATLYNFGNEDVAKNIDDLSIENVLDRWILARFKQTANRMDSFLSKYEVMYGARELAPFVEDLSTWYIRRSRDRISSGDKDALKTLYYVLLNFTKLMAPYVPLLADGMYRNLASIDDSMPESVHMCEFPTYNDLTEEENKLMGDMETVRKIASLANSTRKQAQIPVRQPLSEMIVMGITGLADEYVQLLKDELNVKEVKFEKTINDSLDDIYAVQEEGKLKVALNTVLTDDLKLEGKARELVREIQKLRKQADVAWNEYVDVTYPDENDYTKVVEKFGDEIKTKTYVKNLKKGEKFELSRL